MWVKEGQKPGKWLGMVSIAVIKTDDPIWCHGALPTVHSPWLGGSQIHFNRICHYQPSKMLTSDDWRIVFFFFVAWFYPNPVARTQWAGDQEHDAVNRHDPAVSRDPLSWQRLMWKKGEVIKGSLRLCCESSSRSKWIYIYIYIAYTIHTSISRLCIYI